MKTLAYIRVTAVHPSEDAQRHQIAQAYRVADWFKDDDLSGLMCILELPGFIELCRSAQRGDTVIVSSTECLGSSGPELLRALNALQRKGVAVISVEGGDLSAFGRVALRTLASVARLRRAIRESR